MENKKIKILLAGYVNNINAQDLNCRALAMFLDKDKFKVSAFLVPQQFRDFDIGDEMNGVKLIQLYRPARLLWYWIYFKGILNCDIAYFPKGQKRHWCKFLCKIFRKKSFTTVEGVLENEFYNGFLSRYGSDKKIRNAYNAWDRTFSITKFMATRNNMNLGLRSDGVLYLGVDTKFFRTPDKMQKKPGDPLNIIFIGTDIKRKRLCEFLELARMFPNARFHIVGGRDNEDIFEMLEYEPIPNIQLHGKLDHKRLVEVLKSMDLHIFPSRSEGFPKVTLETAAAGVPSIVYDDYGAEEWITSGKDGYVVNTFDEIVEIINDLQSNHEKLSLLSANAVKMAERFDWKSIVKDWENMLKKLYESK